MKLAVHPWARRLALLLFLAAVALTAQEPPGCRVEVWFSLLPYDAAASLYGKRVADRVSTWLATVSVADACTGPQIVTEHDLSLAASGQNLQVISIASASLVMSSEQNKNGWRRTGRILQDAAMWAAGAALAGKILGPSGKTALGLALPLLGPVGERIIGVAPATVENYLQLVDQRVLSLEPAGAGAMHLWTAPYADGPATRHAEIVRGK